MFVLPQLREELLCLVLEPKLVVVIVVVIIC